MITALSLPLIIGAAGLAVDTVQWTLWKRTLQRTADSAALAGAHAHAQAKDINTAVSYDVTLNDHLSFSATPNIETPPSTGPQTGNANAVRVVLEVSQSLPFSGIFLKGPPVIRAEGTAAVLVNGNFCILSLEDGLATGISATGSAIVDLGCGIASNSRGAQAITVGGSSSVTANPVIAVGGIPQSSSFSGSTVIPYSAPQKNPFFALPQPLSGSCQAKVTVQPNSTRNLTPGCYRGLDFKGTVSLAPGIYYVDGSGLSFGSQTRVTGTGVTFILTSSNAATNPASVAQLDMNGGAYIDLSPPTSGPYEGVLMYQDPRAQTLQTNKINGNSSSRLEGAFYFPSQILEFSGNSGMTTSCIQMVARRIALTGNSSITNDCPVSGAKSFVGTVVRLVG